MCQVDVSTTADGFINLSQEAPGYDVPFSITIAPDQVDILIQWLQEAKKELQSVKQ